MTDNPNDLTAEALETMLRNIARRRNVHEQSLLNLAVEERTHQPVVCVEKHRDWHAYRLGADLIAYALTGDDAFSLMGLRSMAAADALQLCAIEAKKAPGASLGDVLANVVDVHRSTLEPRGWQISWHRRWLKYAAEVESWKSQSSEVVNGDWRSLTMTSGQRELVRVTATLLKLDIPGGLNRGTAADWLTDCGANLLYRRDI